MKKIKVLVSSIGLPTKAIGSWVVRIQKFQDNQEYFDYVLSPTAHPDERYIFCEKKTNNPWYRLISTTSTISKRAESYISSLKKLAGKNVPLQILVMDDQALVQAIASLKPKLPKGSELIFSYHGHSLNLFPWVMDQVDKVLFLTHAGYKASLSINYQFTPEVFIVGNGVLGEHFHAVTPAEKSEKRNILGYNDEDLILLWMANSRPVKGFHLFKKLIPILFEKYPSIKVISIGHEKDATINPLYWNQIGKVPHSELATYLQIGDVYCFTSLWQEGFGLSLAEAVKCGNWALAADNGGIPEVLQDCSKFLLVTDPNILENWVSQFEKLMQIRADALADDPKDTAKLNDWHSYEKWEENYLKALQS